MFLRVYLSGSERCHKAARPGRETLCRSGCASTNYPGVARALIQGLLVLLFLCFVTSTARAEVAAQTDFVHGLVTATESGQAERTLLKGAEIFDRDQINTAPGARAQLRFSDVGLVSL